MNSIAMLELALQIDQQPQDLRLDRNIERRHRFVAHHQLRLQDHRARDADALVLPAGKFVRIAVDQIGIEADLRHHLAHALLALLRGQVAARTQSSGSAMERPASCADRGWRADPGTRSANPARALADRFLLARQQIAAEERHRPRRARQQLHDRARQRGLAAAAFADDAQRLARAAARSSRHRRRAIAWSCRTSRPRT